MLHIREIEKLSIEKRGEMRMYELRRPPSRDLKYIKKIQMPSGKYRYFYTKEELDAYNKEGESNSKEAMLARYRERQKRLLEKTALKNKEEKAKEEQAKAYNDVAERVIKGEFGNGEERYKKLEAAGYDWKRVQNIVNEKLGSSVRLKVDEKETGKLDKPSSKTAKRPKPKIDSKPAVRKTTKTKIGMATKTDKDEVKKKKKKKTRSSPAKRRERGKEWYEEFISERRSW